MNNIIREMLLIEEHSVFRLYEEMISIAGYFVGPLFIIALILEFLGNLDFGGVVKRLLVVMIVLSSFYGLHTKAVDLSLDVASKTLRKVSPKNLFVKKWYEGKLKTKEKKGWGYLESIAIPNLNDLLATSFFLLAKVFTWLLKLIFSSVYHLTYVFAGITALLYFFGWTNKSLVGTFQSSLWCILLPYVVVAILAMVGNSINSKAMNGDLAIADIETILWLFGVTLILLLSPIITWAMVKGEGVAGAGAKMGALSVYSGMKAAYMIPFLASKRSPVRKIVGNSLQNSRNLVSRFSPKSQYNKLIESGGVEKENFIYDKKYWNGISENHRQGIREKYGITSSRPEKNMVYYPASSGKTPVPVKEALRESKEKSKFVKSNVSLRKDLTRNQVKTNHTKETPQLRKTNINEAPKLYVQKKPRNKGRK